MDNEECIAEFGPHEDHTDCERIMAEMSNPSEVLDYEPLFDTDPMGYNSDSYIAYLNRN